jgi:hypothetical protein
MIDCFSALRTYPTSNEDTKKKKEATRVNTNREVQIQKMKKSWMD